MKQRMAFTALKQQFAHTLFFAILLYIRPAQVACQPHQPIISISFSMPFRVISSRSSCPSGESMMQECC